MKINTGLANYMKQRDFIMLSQVMQVYRIQEAFIKVNAKHLKQRNIEVNLLT